MGRSRHKAKDGGLDMPCKVLIVTPDVRLGDATRAALRRRGIEASTCSSPEMALKACHAEELDAVVVDLSLPRSSALDLCRAIHSDVLTPVLVVGPQGTEEDARVLMRLGAEGFMRKPLPARELAARILALLERRGYVCASPERQVLRVGRLEINLDGRDVRVGEHTTRLTREEFALLHLLAKAATRVLSPDSVADRICNHGPGREQAVSAYVAALRRKLYLLSGCDVTLVAIPGAGYALLPPLHRA